MFFRILGVFTNQILTHGLGIFVAILATRLLGPEQRGILVVAKLVALFACALVQVGMPSALTYNLARAANLNDGIQTAIGVLLRWLAVALPALGLVYALVYALGRESLLRGLPLGVVFASLIFAAVTFLYELFQSFLEGLQDFRARNVFRTVSPLLLLMTLTYCWRWRSPVTALALISLETLFTTSVLVLGAAYIGRRYHARVSLRVPADWKRSYVGYGLKRYPAGIARNLNYRLDSLILNALLGNRAVGLYSAGVTAPELLLFLPEAASLVLLPRIPSLSERARGKVIVLTVGSCAYLVLGGGILLALLIPWALPAVYGNAFAQAVPAALWLIPGMLALSIFKTLTSAVAGLGRPEYDTYASMIGLLATIALDLLLVPRFGIVGAAWASSIAYWLSALTIFFLYARLCQRPAGLIVRGLLLDPLRCVREHWGQRLVPARASVE